MSLAGSINNLFKKYKKPLAILVLIFFMYKIFKYYSSSYEGYSNTGNQSLEPIIIPPGPIIIPPGPGPTPTKCEKNSNCQSCISSNCFWGDRDQKCSSTNKSGYGKICSGLDPTCPKCDECPKLTLLKTPTFITQQ